MILPKQHQSCGMQLLFSRETSSDGVFAPYGLNMAEIELSVLHRQCLQARIPDHFTLKEKVDAWENRRNTRQSTVHWRFTTEDARIKLHKLYPSIDI